jgi:hypothetical protein
MPAPEVVTPDTPLRLEIAAALAFPDGSMTASGLRREGARGRLVIERIAGKDFTTLANIERMRDLCRVEAKVHGSGFNQHAEIVTAESSSKPSGSSGTVASSAALEQARAKLSKLKTPSGNTSTGKLRRESATVTRVLS